MANEKRLIDANAFLKALNERPLDFLDVGGDFGYFDETIESVLSKQPTVDAVEVVHLQWDTELRHYDGVIDTYSHMCPRCRYLYRTVRVNGHNYCPNCGAKMDGGKNDGC